MLGALQASKIQFGTAVTRTLPPSLLRLLPALRGALQEAGPYSRRSSCHSFRPYLSASVCTCTPEGSGWLFSLGTCQGQVWDPSREGLRVTFKEALLSESGSCRVSPWEGCLLKCGAPGPHSPHPLASPAHDITRLKGLVSSGALG